MKMDTKTHAHCHHPRGLTGDALSDAIQQVEAECTAKNLRLTKTRKRVLEVILSANGPAKAYDILAAYSTPQPKPPTVYRALQFLVAEGFVHRIEQLNAFVPCRVDCHDMAAFLICDTCEHVEEYAAPKPNIDTGFVVRQWSVEGIGTCATCLENAG